MKSKTSYSNQFVQKFFVLLCLSFSVAAFAYSQDVPPGKDLASQRAEALKLVGQNRYLDALPILEKIASMYPKDAEIWADYGIAVLANSSTLATPEARKKERLRGREILLKAKQLGTENVQALHFLDQVPPDGGGDDNFSADNPEVEKALREGEGFFGRGEYDKAFATYEKAYKINPKSYEAVLFMGDSLYAQRKYKESEVWFAKAAAIEPNRENAYRFWGDALMGQNKTLEARDKFVLAFVAEPFSRLTLDRLGRWVQEAQITIAPTEIIPPGSDSGGDLTIDEKLLKAENGTVHWKLYNDARKARILENTRKSGRTTLAAEANAWRKVADAARRDIKAGKLKTPDSSLLNLIKIDDAGFLEAYLLIMRPQENFADDFFEYREKNRDKMKRFVIEYLLGLKS